MTTLPASVIVLTHNTREMTLRCLATFAPELLATGWQVIVVDNASTDGTLEAIHNSFPEIETIQSERNLGFAGGNNLGLRRAYGECVILVNSDVIATADTLKSLAGVLQASLYTGAISAGLLTADGIPQAFAFGCDPHLSYLIRRGLQAVFANQPLHQWDVDQPLEIDWVSGACLCVRQTAIQQVGLLDERFTLYFEDNDWCLRMRRAGWRVVYDPRFRVTHLGGASQLHRQIAYQLYYDSLVKFYAKHYGPTATLLLRCLLFPYRPLMLLYASRKLQRLRYDAHRP